MESHLKWADYLIFVGFLVISLAIGIYHSLTGGRQKTVAEFIMGNRRLKVIPTAISLLVSFQSAILLLGMTAEMYCYGIQYVIFGLISVVLAVVVVERFIVPWLYPLKLVSIYDYLEKRYMSKSIRIFGASLAILNGVVFMGLVTYAPSAALEFATGLPLSASIPVMAVVSITYTALGGMRAVIWTDVFQFVTMVAGMVAICVKGLIVVGGITNVFRLAGEEGRLVWANLDPRERHTVWGLLLGIGIAMIYSYGLTQPAFQRYSAVDKLSKARRLVLLNIPPLIITLAMADIIGLIVLAYYSYIKCDPLVNKDIANPNQLLPYFVVTIFADSPGFAGLFLATLYGASLSTVSSVLSSSAANCWEDILNWKLNHLPEDRKTCINRLLVVLFGALTTAVAFLSASLPGPIIQVMMALVSSINGPLCAIFILGAVSKHANWKGTLLGGIVGVLMTLWLSIGSMTVSHKHPPLPPVSVEQCSLGNSNSTLFEFSLNYTTYRPLDVLDGMGSTNNWNQTTQILSISRSHVTQLRGLENFYAISYLWFTPFAVIITGLIGITASLIMRDKDLETQVDERLLLHFNGCRCSEENENQELTDYKNCALMHGNTASDTKI